MDRNAFFDAADDKLGSISSSAKAGFNLILDEAEKRRTPLNDLAYILATTWWETAKTMAPVREAFYISKDFETAEKWRRKNLWYYPYYGRGYVQLTHKANYKFAGTKLGADFVGKPDKVMDPQYAVQILFDGMAEGWFTGKKLDDYIDDIDEGDNKDLDEYIQARRIINGQDKAATIGSLALVFERALKAGSYDGTSAAAAAPVALLSAASSVSGQAGFEAHINAIGLKNFKPYEFLVKGNSNANPGSAAFDLNTDPPAGLWNNIVPTARVLDELRNRLQRPITLLSVYRSPAYNKAIGGAAQSQHTQFRAVDFVVQGSPVGPLQWASALRDMRSAGLFKGGIGTYASFVHVDTRGSNADWTG